MHKPTVIAILCALPCLAWGVTRAVQGITYEQEVGGFLKQAADANTSELAEKKIKQAIDGMDRRGLCNSESPEAPATFSEDCYTSILWRTPDEDVGYWRTNIQATYDDLHTMTPEERANNLTESNQLMKVRETLLDNGSDGDSVTAPEGISVYPNNAAFFWWGTLSTLLLLGAGTWWFRETT
jgi:hypothetical protein